MQSVFSTRDLKLAAILLTEGFQFENPAKPATRIKRESGDESTVFHFNATHPETDQSASEIMRKFSKGEDYIAENPESPLASMMAVLFNRDEIISVVKQIPRQIVFERKGKIISISENATAEDKARIAKFL